MLDGRLLYANLTAFFFGSLYVIKTLAPSSSIDMFRSVNYTICMVATWIGVYHVLVRRPGPMIPCEKLDGRLTAKLLIAFMGLFP